MSLIENDESFEVIETNKERSLRLEMELVTEIKELNLGVQKILTYLALITGEEL